MLPNIPSSPDLRKIVVLNPKGGSGKSTIATNLAGFLAASGQRVALMDFDNQGSSMRWLSNRPDERPVVHGIAAYEKDMSQTRSFRLRIPDGIKYVVIDTPAALHVQDLSEFTRGVHAILVPVLPSDIDIHAASRLIADMLIVAKVSRRMGRLGVVANRVRENTLAYRKLMRFLDRLSIPVVGELRDSQNYVAAAEEGLCVQEMTPSKAEKDIRSWVPITSWLEERLKTPVSSRDKGEGDSEALQPGMEPAPAAQVMANSAPPVATEPTSQPASFSSPRTTVNPPRQQDAFEAREEQPEPVSDTPSNGLHSRLIYSPD
jgi:chromosome partitioning protein